MTVREKARQVYISSCGVIPGGVNSPVRSFKELNMLPMVVKSGKGDMIWDVDGNPYIDYCMSWGALILGHADDDVVENVYHQLKLGSTFGIMTEVERDMAYMITSIVPGLDKVRFVSSGTEAVMSAIRLSRGFTGKNTIVKFNGNYHGHVDSLLIQSGSSVSLLPESSSLGVPREMVKYTISLPYNDVELVRTVLRQIDDLAAVILEPVAANMGVVPASQEFMQMLREETEKKEALLIFDEVITGFRVGLKGASEIYGVKPDLFCFGKIVGGGLPAAAFGGRSDVMDCLSPLGGVYQAGTLSGNPLAMQAGIVTLTKLQVPSFYSDLETKANILLDPIQQVIEDRGLDVQLQRVGSMFTFFFSPKPIRCKEDLAGVDENKFKMFYEYLFSEGIYMAPSQFESNFVSSSHKIENLVRTRDRILRFFSKM
ncbi:MAG: glutamate-1-semialdehyde-2,1-aminomutase [Chlamydiae bacterium]|nr:glutamate-1-semialdehyde-2,1-aminomutase [Chlamydiota bacterium]